MKLSIIIPTITGREESLERALNAYRTRTTGFELEIITPLNYPTWPAGCNAGFVESHGDIVHFSADDLEPLEGWSDAMMTSINDGFLPGARLWDHVQSGSPIYEMFDGVPGTICRLARVPSMPTWLVDKIGPIPEAIHYYSDNWISDKAGLLGWQTRVTEGYDFLHHWAQVGRLDGGDWKARYLPLYNEERAKLGLEPVRE